MVSPRPVLLEKTMALLSAILADGGANTLETIAGGLGLPRATAYRSASSMTRFGLIVACGGGRYLPGVALAAASAAVPPNAVLARVATPFLNALSRRSGEVAHLGVLEADMVTYLVKTGSGPEAEFTRQGQQLEAYCSGMGKALLAHLPAADLDAYLDGGPFVMLTANTITRPDALRSHLEDVRRRGFALDEEEVAEDLRCVAVPLRDHLGQVRAAISISASRSRLPPTRTAVARRLLDHAARGIESRLFGSLERPGRWCGSMPFSGC
jgi:IclR family acetate operon transcriptional repressor